LRDGGLFFLAMDRVYAMARRKRPPVDVAVNGRVPLGRGLGSSATAVVGGGSRGQYVARRTLLRPTNCSA
jgi:homoserine kinase